MRTVFGKLETHYLHCIHNEGGKGGVPHVVPLTIAPILGHCEGFTEDSLMQIARQVADFDPADQTVMDFYNKEFVETAKYKKHPAARKPVTQRPQPPSLRQR